MRGLLKGLGRTDIAGVSIDSRHLRVVSFKRSRSKLELEKDQEITLSGKVLEGSRISDSQTLAEELENLFDVVGQKNKQVVTAVPGPNVVIRQLFFPSMSKKELDSAVEWEAQDILPYDLEEVEMDYMESGKVETDEGEKTRVVLAAVPKDILRDFYEVFSQAGLKLNAIEVEPIALSRIIDYFYQPQEDFHQCQAIIDIGEENTNLAVVSKRGIEFTRIIAYGLSTVYPHVSENLGVSLEEANEIMEKGEGIITSPEEGLSEKQLQLSNSLQIGLGDIIDEVQRSLSYFRTQNRELNINNLVLSGRGTLIQDLEKHFIAEINIPSEILSFPVNSSGSKDTYLPSQYAIATGLALREVLD